jgi:pyridoxamine 5'-phosphate oxidase
MKIPKFAEKPKHEPWKWLNLWLNDAELEGETESTAMALSTIDKQGAPRTRFVLCKGVNEDGIRFFTNLNSAKGNEISDNPVSSIAFHWPKMNRQVRVQGNLVRVSDLEADEYFHSRNKLSKIGAWASKQSQPLDSRETLLKAVSEFSDKYQTEVPRPPHWTGFRLIPDYWEFWQGHDGRLHDRWVVRPADDAWLSWRLYP